MPGARSFPRSPKASSTWARPLLLSQATSTELDEKWAAGTQTGTQTGCQRHRQRIHVTRSCTGPIPGFSPARYPRLLHQHRTPALVLVPLLRSRPAQLPAKASGEAVESGPRAAWEMWKEPLLWPGPAPAIATIWGVNQRGKISSFSLCNFAFQINK